MLIFQGIQTKNGRVLISCHPNCFAIGGIPAVDSYCHRYADSVGFSGGCLLDYANIYIYIYYTFVYKLYINAVNETFSQTKRFFFNWSFKNPDFLWGFCPPKRTIGPLFLPNEKAPKQNQTKSTSHVLMIFWCMFFQPKFLREKSRLILIVDMATWVPALIRKIWITILSLGQKTEREELRRWHPVFV